MPVDREKDGLKPTPPRTAAFVQWSACIDEPPTPESATQRVLYSPPRLPHEYSHEHTLVLKKSEKQNETK